jgi:hypothetical protein
MSEMRNKDGFSIALALAGLALCACGADDEEAGRGDVSFNVWGEEFIEAEIPAGEVQDGWTVKFTKFLITIGNVTIADSNAGNAGSLVGTRVLDLVTPGPHDIGALSNLEARAWDKVGYGVSPANAQTTLHSSATEADLTMMKTGGYSVHVEGNATGTATTKTFSWSFTNDTAYTDCVAEVEGKETPGLVVTNGGTEAVQLTIHGDHFFYDDLASEEAVPRFNAISAADANGNGEVTFEELTAVKLVDIEEGTYGTGSASHVDDLGAFVQALTRTLGHYRGEGHCAESGD